eukprot:2003986-Amphidinium_carterae.1
MPRHKPVLVLQSGMYFPEDEAYQLAEMQSWPSQYARSISVRMRWRHAHTAWACSLASQAQ